MEEIIDIVDESDNVIGQDKRTNKFEKEFISRNVAIFILDGKGDALIVRRSPQKRSFPNRYDLAACGNVMSGESYMEAAKRELKEELGIECELNFLEKIFNEFKEKNKTLKYFTGVFMGYHEGEIKLNDELVEPKWLSIKQIEKMLEENNELFTPGFVKDFASVKDRLI